MTPPNPQPEYAIWTIPGTDFTVQYALQTFHEIDFQVNEAYRRIPHGGIEIGGLLFGRLDKRSATIEAFRLIECEHVAGPSFNLSDRDLSKLDQQIADSKTDPDLKELVPVGWFVAHTRSTLCMSEKEVLLFNRYFPDPGKIAVLVKPERFQPTRFGFLVREANGHIKTDANEVAIILPLPGRGTGVRSGSGPIASIAAPPAPEPKTKSTLETPGQRRDKPPAEPAARTESLPRREAAPRIDPPAGRDPAPVAPPPFAREPLTKPERPPQRPKLWPTHPPANGLDALKSPAETVALHSSTGPQDLSAQDTSSSASPEGSPGTQTRPLPEAPPRPLTGLHRELELTGSHPEAEPPANPGSAPAMPLAPLEEIRKRRSPDLAPESSDERPRSRRTQPLLPEPKIWNLRLTAVLILAAALGCGVGYLGYLQLPSAIIPLKVRKRPSALLVSWPPEQTRDAVYASIRVDDGQPMALTAEEKASGITEVKSGASNVKIELISKHWMRDSRGIVRYVRVQTATAGPARVSPDNIAQPSR
jgi:hypothetical protein